MINERSMSEAILGYFTDKIDKGEYKIDTVDCHADIQVILRSLPTAYDVDKVLKEMAKAKATAKDLQLLPEYCREKMKRENCINFTCEECLLLRYEEIVKSGGVEL